MQLICQITKFSILDISKLIILVFTIQVEKENEIQSQETKVERKR